MIVDPFSPYPDLGMITQPSWAYGTPPPEGSTGGVGIGGPVKEVIPMTGDSGPRIIRIGGTADGDKELL